MDISKFKLISGGCIGITVEATESIVQENKTILDRVQRTRPYPIPDVLREKIQKLKYFYLNLTGHWVEPYNKFFDLQKYEPVIPEGASESSKTYIMLQSLLNHTEITGVSTRNAGFSMQGTVETVEGKKMGYSTPFITEEDDVSFYIEATDKINIVFDDIVSLLHSTKAIEFNAPATAKAIGISSDVMNGMTEQEKMNLVIEVLYQRGAIVLKRDDYPDNIEGEPDKGGDRKTTLYANSGSIDSHNMPEADIEKDVKTESKVKKEKKKEEKQGPSPEPEKKSIGKGTLTSDKNFPLLDDKPVNIPREDTNIPEGGSIEDLEYSENLGMARDEMLIEEPAPEDNELD